MYGFNLYWFFSLYCILQFVMKHFGRPCSVLKRALEIKLNLKKLNLNSYNNLGHKETFLVILKNTRRKMPRVPNHLQEHAIILLQGGMRTANVVRAINQRPQCKMPKTVLQGDRKDSWLSLQWQITSNHHMSLQMCLRTCKCFGGRAVKHLTARHGKSGAVHEDETHYST